MRLIHYSHTPLGPIYSKEQGEANYAHGVGKPSGLWVSVEGEDDWANWCTSEQFRDIHKQLAYEVTLTPDACILYIKNVAELDEFTKTYVIHDPRFSCFNRIDWARVAGTYQGIIIAPYQWDRRLTQHTFWYYGWDCASGCIWDKGAILSTKEIIQPERLIREDEE